MISKSHPNQNNANLQRCLTSICPYPNSSHLVLNINHTLTASTSNIWLDLVTVSVPVVPREYIPITNNGDSGQVGVLRQMSYDERIKNFSVDFIFLQSSLLPATVQPLVHTPSWPVCCIVAIDSFHESVRLERIGDKIRRWCRFLTILIFTVAGCGSWQIKDDKRHELFSSNRVKSNWPWLRLSDPSPSSVAWESIYEP